MRTLFRGLVTTGLVAFSVFFTILAGASDEPSAERGQYLVRISGCNDCHTAGYAENYGTTPVSEWLMGDRLGWRGGWGTTYAPNLRLSLAKMTEEQWLSFARNLQSRPPMPSFNLNAMNEDDLKSIYRFVRQLQPLGDPAPAYVPPDQEPSPPYVVFPAPPPAG